MRNVWIGIDFIRPGIGVFVVMATLFADLSKAQAPGDDLFSKKPDRLYDYYLQEIQTLNDVQVQSLNEKFRQDLQNHLPLPNTRRAQAIDRARVQKMLEIVVNHPVIGLKVDDVYARPGEEMGFCFGRVMYLHLLALKLGLQKESIKKIWALGPMQSDAPNIFWGYHVALLVFSKDREWLVLDANFGVFTAAEWMQKFAQASLDHRIRFYATEPDKFGLYAGTYSRYILGLDLTITEDWYKHYFVDLLKATREESLEQLGLSKISASEGQVSLPKNP